MPVVVLRSGDHRDAAMAELELLATPGNSLDAVVLGINAVTFWYALRENGFLGPLAGSGRLLREHQRPGRGRDTGVTSRARRAWTSR